MLHVRVSRAIQRHGICCRVAFILLFGLPLLPPAAAVLAEDAPVGQTAADRRFAAHIAEASQRFDISEAWIRAVLDAESAHDTGAVSDARAMGLMQVMPDTWAELRIRYSLGEDPFDPRDNILAGAAYLREMLDRYGNIGAMLAAYNAGPGRYDEYLATGRPLPAETRDYVAKLAPILGGEPLPRGVSTTPSPPADWREAPLFVAPRDRRRSCRFAAPERSTHGRGDCRSRAPRRRHHPSCRRHFRRQVQRELLPMSGVPSHRILANCSGPWRARRREPRAATGRWRDKMGRGAPRSVGCLSMGYEPRTRCALFAPTSRRPTFFCDLSALARGAVSRP